MIRVIIHDQLLDVVLRVIYQKYENEIQDFDQILMVIFLLCEFSLCNITILNLVLFFTIIFHRSYHVLTIYLWIVIKVEFLIEKEFAYFLIVVLEFMELFYFIFVNLFINC